MSEQNVSDQYRNNRLSDAIADGARHGWAVESTQPDQVIMVKGKPVRHWLHAILTILSAGLWLPVWIAVWWRYRTRRKIVRVDAQGVVTVT